MGQARHHARHQDIEHGADRETAQYADGHAALRILGFLRDGRHAIEADIGEKDDAEALQDAAPAELAKVPRVLRYVREPVVRVGQQLAPEPITAITMATLIATMMELTIADSLIPL